MKLSKEFQMSIHNRFDIEVLDTRTGKIRQKAQAQNVICDSLWGILCRPYQGGYQYGYCRYIAFGSGTGTPSTSDTALFNLLGKKSCTESGSGFDGYGCYYGCSVDDINGVMKNTQRIKLTTTEYVGSTFTEVGLMGGDSGGNTLTTHAMLQDMNGNPISILKTNTDEITIYATIFIHYNSRQGIWLEKYPSADFWSGIGGKNDILKQLFGIVGTSSELSINMSMRNGRHEESLANTLYVDGNWSNRLSFSQRIGTDKGNMYGIRHFGTTNTDALSIIQGSATWSPFTITGESVGTGDGSNKKFKTHFSCPYNATVYVNGVAVNDVVVKKLPPALVIQANNVDYDFIIVELYDLRSEVNNMIPWSRVDSDYGGTWVTAKNLYKDYGDFSLGGNIDAWVSDDMINWEHYDNNNAQHKRKLYIKCDIGRFRTYASSIAERCTYDGYNIEFTTAPANGDVITIDYTTDYIPKDSDHVVDFSIVFNFSTYSPT